MTCGLHEYYLVGEVGVLLKMGQSRKSRLRRNDKTWKPPVSNDVKLNPRPAGPLDFPPPAGGGGRLNAPP